MVGPRRRKTKGVESGSDSSRGLRRAGSPEAVGDERQPADHRKARPLRDSLLHSPSLDEGPHREEGTTFCPNPKPHIYLSSSQ